MKISFIIPVYNAEQYIEKCISHLMPMIESGHEVIIMNDGSTDNSQSIIEDIARVSNGNIVVMKQDNQGQSVARNRCIDAATGDYICFVDADDYLDITPECDIVKAAERGIYDAIVFGLQLDYAGKSIKAPLLQNTSYPNGKDYFKAAVMDRTFRTFPVNKLFKRSIIADNNIRFTPGRIYEDMLFNVQFIAKAGKVASIDSNPYHYTLTNIESSTYKPREKDLDCLYMVEYAEEWMNNNNCEIESDNKHYLIMIFSFISSCILKKYVPLHGNSLADDIINKTMKHVIFRKAAKCCYKSRGAGVQRRFLAFMAYHMPKLYVRLVKLILK